MKKILTLVLLILVINNCTELMTKQFVTETSDNNSNIKMIENWIINPPNLIAFKNKRVDQITDTPQLYWLTINANTVKDINGNNTLTIDSVGLEFIGLDSIIWRCPTRVVPYKESKNKSYLAFDFYKNEGVMVPDSVKYIKLFFDAIIIDTITNSRISHEVSFDMVRQDTLLMSPFMMNQ